MASTHSIADSFLPVTALRSFMSHFDPRLPSPSAPDAPASDPTDSGDPMAGYRELEARVRAEAAAKADETPALRRAMAVVASEHPQSTDGQCRLLARAIVQLGDREAVTDFERRVRAAYAGHVLETTPSGLINPTPVDWTALWLSQQLPGAAMHVYRGLVTKMLLHVRLRAPLSPEQTRLHSVYRKAQSELGTEEAARV